MISHVYLGINDFSRAFHFYSAVLNELGLIVKFSEPEQAWAGWVAPDAPRPLFLIGKPQNGEAMSVGNGQMIALLAPSRQAVIRTYDAAMALGATCEGPPGLRPHYHADYYGAYFRDLEGNKICVCCHHPENA